MFVHYLAGPTCSVHREDGGELKPVSVHTTSAFTIDNDRSLSVWSHVNHAWGCFNEQSVQTNCQETLSLVHTQSIHTTANSQGKNHSFDGEEDKN